MIDPAQVCPVQAVFETGLGDDDRLDLVTGKDTAVLVYPDGENLDQLSGTVTFRIPDSPDSALESTTKEVSASTYREIASRNTYPSDPGCPCEIEGEDEITAENYIALYSSAVGTGDKAVRVEIDPSDSSASVAGDSQRVSKPVTNRETESIDLAYYRVQIIDIINPLPEEIPLVGPPLEPEPGIPTIEPSPSEALELKQQADKYVPSVFPIASGKEGYSSAAKGGWNAAATVIGLPAVIPVIGQLADLALLDYLTFLDTDGMRAVGIVNQDYFRYHGISGGRTGGITAPVVPFTNQNLFKSILVSINSPTSVAHELGHQYDLHTEFEEYKISGADKTDGFWINSPSGIEEYINCQPSFMEETLQPENRFDRWIDNKDESVGAGPTREDCDDDGFEKDFADYDHLFDRLRPSGFFGLDTSLSGDEETPSDVVTEPQPGGTALPTGAQSSAITDEILYLKGIVSDDDDAVYPTRWHYLQDRQLPPTADGSFTAVIRDAAGSVLTERSFAVPFGLHVDATADVEPPEELDSYGYFSFPMEFPDGARTAEIRRDGSVLTSTEIISKLLTDAIYPIPAEGFVGPNTEEAVRQHKTDLIRISDRLGQVLEAGQTREAVQILRREFRPALDQRLKDEYTVEGQLTLTREEVSALVSDIEGRLSTEISQADEYGSIFDPDALTTGDVVTTKVTSQEDTGPDAKAGVMVRNDIEGSGDARGYVICAVTPDSGFSMEWDSDGTGYLDTTRQAGETTYPCWLRLRKDGTTFVGSYSTDGEEWTEIASTTLPEAAATQDAGVFAASGTLEATSEVEFEAFSVDPRS